ncbi:vWA domain-containing protein [Pleionea litopenaei]|uniref:VWA domain-containing protein n=1 Tax=Pleionea litopenaei TaxID=3070815 RepID=A0AA51X7D8_9GAMM|nr:vWA domain-containing protein [Pleionea sp. HL-JVS1]WMS87776.1 vWA domain-containing protein [Pleionea sp. HL-JVS1]
MGLFESTLQVGAQVTKKLFLKVMIRCREKARVSGSFKAANLLIAFLAVLSVPVFAQQGPQKPSDVRLLIDISGSMKQNDPNNLRIPALRMVTNLMPKGSEAGVWAFGRYVNMLVPIKTVDQQWQDSASAAAGKINSAGLFTNIGDAMAKSSWDWNRPSDSETRSMILLTDGMVDISKDAAKNAAERKRILQDILPRLKAAGVTIHTIALSEQADKELLQTLSNQTDGWFQAVSNADELQKVFLKIFEQATPRDSLPLENNQFKVDNSIEEMTLLVFREAGSQKAELIAPTAETIRSDSSRGNVRWFSSNTYDLVTITNPQPGDWQINAAIDPDNRVMVVSKLGLKVDDVPNNVLAKEQINYQVQLLEEGKVITKPDFLDLVDANLQTEYQGAKANTPLLKEAASGTFKQVFYSGEKDGVLQIKLVVKSPTFERSRTHAINIYGNPVQADLQMSYVENEPHQIHLRIIDDIVNPDSLNISGQVTYPDETTQFVAIDNWNKNQTIAVKNFPKGGDYRVNLTAKGESPTGRAFKTELSEIAFTAEPLPGYEPVVETPKEELKPEPEPKQETPPEPEVTEPEQEEKKPEPEPESEQKKEEPLVEEQLTEPEEEPVNWTLWLSVGFGGNLLLLGLGWYIWRLVRKKSQQNSDLMTQELFAENDSAEEKE